MVDVEDAGMLLELFALLLVPVEQIGQEHLHRVMWPHRGADPLHHHVDDSLGVSRCLFRRGRPVAVTITGILGNPCFCIAATSASTVASNRLEYALPSSWNNALFMPKST